MVPQKILLFSGVFWEGERQSRCESTETHKKIQSVNLIRSHVIITTTVTVIIISLITNIKIAIIIIVITKSDYHNNDNNSNNNNNNKNDNNVFLIDHSFKKMLFNSNY